MKNNRIDPLPEGHDEQAKSDEQLISSMVSRTLFQHSQEQATRNTSVHVLRGLESKNGKRSPWIRWTAIATPVAAALAIAVIYIQPRIGDPAPVAVSMNGALASNELTADMAPDSLADMDVTPDVSVDVLDDYEHDLLVAGLAEAITNESDNISNITEDEIDVLLQDVDTYTM